MWLNSYSPAAEVNQTNYLKISVEKLNSRIGVVENQISFMEDQAKKFPQNIVWKEMKIVKLGRKDIIHYMRYKNSQGMQDIQKFQLSTQ